MNKIPVFLHIPKNAGTYVLGVTMSLFRYYGTRKGWKNKIGWNLNLRRILLQKKDKQIATLFVYDPEEIRHVNLKFKSLPTNEYCNVVDLNDFCKEFKRNQLTLFSIIIEDHGVKYIKDGLFDGFCTQADSTPFYYTILRDPYERALSLYSYITSSASLHEPTHNKFICGTFIDYINSYQLEDSWLIRKLSKIPDNEKITEDAFNEACSILNNFTIKDIFYTDQLLQDTFLTCYGISQNLGDQTSINANKNSNSKKTKIKFDELNEETKKIFLERTEFDKRLYQKYCST